MLEAEVMNLTVKKFYLYLGLEQKRVVAERMRYATDTAAAIGGAMSKDGLTKYYKALTGD